jgi:AGCS family alanine or glycine:cation symporter
MWMGAFLGIATKFFTCTLAVLYRGKDSRGELQGGPMYVIVEGLGERWRPLASFFCLCALVGVFPLFQANQLVQVIRDVLIEPSGLITDPSSLLYFNFSMGVATAAIVGLVVVGGIQRIGAAASRLVPLMVSLYCGIAVWILAMHIADIPSYFALILEDAFTGNAVLGGSVGSVIAIGVKRSAFSNEAGIGTEAMAHGAARTKEPIREGLVAMLGPAIDTLIVCSATAAIILSSGVWKTSESNGVTLTAEALSEHLPGVGPYLLVVCVFFFGISTMFSYNYYGVKSLSFLVGAERAHLYNYLYLPSIVVASVVTASSVVNLIDGMFALMAIPTMTSTLLLSPKVMQAARTYFRKLEQD